MIGYYVHHQGVGHLHRMLEVTTRLRTPVTVLSSLERPPDFRGAWIQLDRDDEDVCPRDVTAHGTLHWAPRHSRGVSSRAARITDWLESARPAFVVVDVSVEVSLLVRLAGVPVVVVAMPGDRSDRAHATAYDLADALLAPWPVSVRSGWPDRWLQKAWHVGAFSRFDGQSRPADRCGNGHQALLLWGEGGPGIDASRLAQMRNATPEWEWVLAHPGRRLDREAVWRAVCEADVVVTHGGQGAVGEVAAARSPAVVIAEARPFDEQLQTVRALREGNVAVGLDEWPQPARWATLLAQAIQLGGDGWQTWSPGDGAVRAAAALDGLASAFPATSGARR